MECIPLLWVCNGERDCSNGNDEADVTCSKLCIICTAVFNIQYFIYLFNQRNGIVNKGTSLVQVDYQNVSHHHVFAMILMIVTVELMSQASVVSYLLCVFASDVK